MIRIKRTGIIGGSGFMGSYITVAFLIYGFEVKVPATKYPKIAWHSLSAEQ